MYLIKQVSEISGVSVRTLHHYDEIGLLSPKKQENGYRYYSDEELSQLQTILYYKYLGFSLKEIKSLMTQNEDNLLSHLKHQLKLMQKEKRPSSNINRYIRKDDCVYGKENDDDNRRKIQRVHLQG